MKKIGIITFHCAYNYGAVLQAYALKYKMYNHSEIIDYNNDYFKKTNYYYLSSNNIVKRIIRFFNLKALRLKTSRFNEFKNNYLINNSNSYDKETIGNVLNKYDAYLTGSDQVWNLDCTGRDTTYYLDFAQGKKRFSYAASFGKNDISEEENMLVNTYIKQFDLVSVREETAVQVLGKFGIDNVSRVLDPTLLLTGKEWEQAFDLKSIPQRYLLLYNVTGGSEIVEYAKSISKSTGLKIYYITPSIKPEIGLKKIIDAGPVEWMSYIKNAELIITNSYHGCIFSMLFHKKFMVYLAENNMKNATRTVELLKMVDAENILRTKSDNEETISTIDYVKVDKILNNYREDSLSFVRKIIENINE